MRLQKFLKNPFPISATVSRRDASFGMGLLSFGSLYSLAELEGVHMVVLHSISKTTDVDEDVAAVVATLVKHLEVCLRVKGHRLVGYDLEVASKGYDLRVVIESRLQAA